MDLTRPVNSMNSKVKRWYIVKKKSGKQWAAFELTNFDIANLKPEYEYHGPFKNWLTCMIQASQ